MSSAPEDMRQKALQDWMSNLGVHSFELRRFLSTESEQLIWKSEGLPSDDLSMENAMVILEVIVGPPHCVCTVFCMWSLCHSSTFMSNCFIVSILLFQCQNSDGHGAVRLGANLCVCLH